MSNWRSDSSVSLLAEVGEILAAVAAACQTAGVRWYVFGAQAVIAHGAPRATQDVDVTAETANAATLVEALVAEGFQHRFPDIAEELLQSGAVLPLVHRNGMELDVVLAGSPLETHAFGRVVERALDGVRVPVIGVTDLLVAKLIAGRAKDLDDARSLFGHRDLDLDDAEAILTAVDRAFETDEHCERLNALRRDPKGRPSR